MWVLLFVIIATTQGFPWAKIRPSWMPPVWDTSCSFTRDDAMICFAQYVDVDPRDGGITPHEIEVAINKYSTPPIRALFWGIGTKQTMDACDVDHNGILTAKDWVESASKCMPSHANMCSVEWFCKRAQKYGK